MGNLHDNILLLCQAKGITAGRLCKELNLSRGLISDLRAGRRSGISAATAKKIADYFGVTVDEVLNGRKEEDPAVENHSEVEEELQRFRDVDRGLFQVTKDMTVQEVELLTKFALELKRSNRGY